jgi:hypothetical protein
MSWDRPQPTYTRLDLPTYSIGELPQTDPTVIGDAHGKSRDGGRVSVDISGACTLTLFVWSPAAAAWRYPSSAAASYQKTFAAAGMDYFDVPEGALFYIKASAGSITCYADCERPQPVALA